MKLRNCALALCMIFMTAVPCFSHDYDFGFEIAAYKLGKDLLDGQPVKLEITDAISNTLENLNENSKINITPSIDNYLGVVSHSDTTFFSTHAVFSYRVYGCSQGSYTLSFAFGGNKIKPFSRIEGGIDNIDLMDPTYSEATDTNQVGLSFSVHYINYNFSRPSETLTTTTSNESGIDIKEVKYSNGKKGYVYKLSGYDDSFASDVNTLRGNITKTSNFSPSFDVKFSFEVLDAANEIVPNEDIDDGIWSASGVVGITLDSSDYVKAVPGVYVLPVTITLRSDD